MKANTLCAALLLALCCTSAYAQGAQTCPVAGTYSVTGANPGATGQYHGRATISANNYGCTINWAPPNASQGMGTYVNGVLTVHFLIGGNTGVVQYTRQPDGSLAGFWWNDSTPNFKGTETLYPISLSPQ